MYEGGGFRCYSAFCLVSVLSISLIFLYFSAEGEVARVGLASVERGLAQPKPNELNDVTAKNLLKFDDLNPFTYTERTVKVCNYT